MNHSDKLSIVNGNKERVINRLINEGHVSRESGSLVDEQGTRTFFESDSLDMHPENKYCAIDLSRIEAQSLENVSVYAFTYLLSRLRNVPSDIEVLPPEGFVAIEADEGCSFKAFNSEGLEVYSENINDALDDWEVRDAFQLFYDDVRDLLEGDI